MKRLSLIAGCCVVCWAALAGGGQDEAQRVPPAPQIDEAPPAAGDDKLRATEEQLAARYKRFEEVLLRLAELSAGEDPQRAALLRQAVARSKKRAIAVQFDKLTALLGEERLSVAVTSQSELSQDLKNLLELLLSEDRAERLESEQARVRAYLKEVNKLIKEQQAIQTQTKRQPEARELADRQGKLGQRTGKLADDIERDNQQADAGEGEEQDAQADEGGEKNKPEQSPDGEQKADKQGGQNQDGQDKEGESKERENKDGEQSQGSPSENKQGDNAEQSDKSKSSDGQPGDKQDGEQPKEENDGQQGEPSDQQGGQPQDGQQQSGQPQPGQQQDGQQQQGEQQGEQQQGEPAPQRPSPQDEAQKRIKEAQQRMKQAQEKLEQAQREEAADRQREAIEELEQAKADLELILRQLREEELSRVLAFLEARFRKMLEAQTEVYDATKRLDALPADERGRSVEIESGRLSRKESQIVVEADKALALLRDDATAVAMPEAVQELRDDMADVAGRLEQFKVDQIAITVEEDIIAGLEEILAALEKAQKELEQQKGQSQPPQPGEPQEPPLIDAIAELKMIRALQMRVNRRTETYSKMIEGEQAHKPDLLKALAELAQRQERIYRTTRDIALGKNQ